MSLISYVVPVLNESENILNVIAEVDKSFSGLGLENYELLFIDDGSTDDTIEIIRKAAAVNPSVKCIQLSRNFGHQAAVSAGIDYAKGDYVAILDGDLQDPPEVIGLFLTHLLTGGFDIVYGVRKKRKESFLKRISYKSFYRVLSLFSSIDIPLDAGDFCLMSRKAVNLIKSMPEKNRFVRGIRSYIGLKQGGFQYNRPARANGEPKYTIKKLLRLASDGIFNFSDRPLKIATIMGFFTSFVSVAAALGLFIQRITGARILGATPEDVPGYTSLIVAVFFLSGVQLFTLGIIGEYLARIFLETKHRPGYLVADVVNI